MGLWDLLWEMDVSDDIFAVSDFICLKTDNEFCLLNDDFLSVLDGTSAVLEALVPGSEKPAAEITEAADFYCENTCIQSLVSAELLMAVPGGRVECLPEADQAPYLILQAACYENGGAYCIDTVLSSWNESSAMFETCDLEYREDDDGNGAWWDPDAECSAACKDNVTRVSELLGCCAQRVGHPAFAAANDECAVAAAPGGRARAPVLVGRAASAGGE